MYLLSRELTYPNHLHAPVEPVVPAAAPRSGSAIPAFMEEESRAPKKEVPVDVEAVDPVEQLMHYWELNKTNVLFNSQ